jgi:hypothetical protein
MLIAALPAGLLGASEASRLQQLIDVLDLLDVVPALENIDALLERYGTPDQLPASMLGPLECLLKLKSGPDTDPGGVSAFESPELEGGSELPDEYPPRRWRFPSRGVTGLPRLPWRKRGENYEYQPRRPLPAPHQDDPPDPRPLDRYVRAEFLNHDLSEPLAVGQSYQLVIFVSTDQSGLTSDPIDLAQWFASNNRDLELTIDLSSTDFAVGDAQGSLWVPPTGGSRNEADFEVSPLRSGQCQLTATFYVRGNFLTQLQLTVPVGEPGQYTAETIGRPVNSAVTLTARDLTLNIDPTGSGYTVTVKDSNRRQFQTTLPVTEDGLAAAAAAARAALNDVVDSVYNGTSVFQDAVDIPPDVEQEVLKKLAFAGNLLFQSIFQPTGADGTRISEVGDWLIRNATNPAFQLTVSVVATRVPIPWSMLYLGDASDDAQLDWNNFLGFRHIIEQLPFQSLDGPDSNDIDSWPTMAVSACINPNIDDDPETLELVANHAQYWRGLRTDRPSFVLCERSTRTEVVDVLKDPENPDRVLYFYCHATSNDNDPKRSAIDMGAPLKTDGSLTLGYLNVNASMKIKLASQPLIILNACESAELSPKFYDGFVPYFLAKGSRGVIGTECKTPILFAIHWAEEFVKNLLDGRHVGQTMLNLRQQFLREHHNPLGLLYTMYCSADTRVAPPLSLAR